MQPEPAQTTHIKRRSPDWIVAVGWPCLAIYTALVDHRYLVAAIQVLVGMGYLADNLLLSESDAKWRVYVLWSAAILAGVITFWPKLSR